MATKNVSIQIEEEMLEKLRFISDYDGHSINGHVLMLIQKHLKQFEEQNGEINGEIKPDSNIKVTKKK